MGGGVVSVDTRGSNYDHAVTAWTGSPGNFVALGCTVNSSGYYIPAPLSFRVNSSAPIHFMVSTFYVGSTGTLKFSLNVGPGFTLAANPTSSSVPYGSPATYTVTVTPKFGSFNDPIALSCNVDPPGPLCSLSDPSVTPGAAATSVTLTVATTNVADLKMPGSTASIFAFWIALPTFGLLVVRTTLPCRKKTRRGILLVLLLTLVLLGMLVACGGGSSGGSSPPPPLASKTYTITVVGTSGTISQQTTTSLTVTP
jgi:hypothetical protein